MPWSCEQKDSLRIVHELPGRLRIRSPMLHDPVFDPAYAQAVLLTIAGVSSARFNLKAGTVVVTYDGSPESREHILESLASMPQEAFSPLRSPGRPPDPVGTGVKGVLALMTPALPRTMRGLAAWAMSLPVLGQGVDTLINEGTRVEVLDASAVALALLRRDFPTAASIIALLSLGEYLEDVCEDQSTGLLKRLLQPQVETVRVKREDRELTIAGDQVQIRDQVVCGPGELIAVDGEVIEGEALANQSFITGESVPVHIQPGDEAISGSVIQEGRVIISARQVGKDTGMARINRFLEDSLRFQSSSQKKSQALADRLVPATLALGLGILLATRDLRRAAAVLTVDYSCSIKLANPVAVKTSMYTAARHNVLLKGSQALEAMAQVDTLVLDKTGTLTQGVLRVTDIIPTAEMSEHELLALAAGAEEHYAHPMARAVVKEARQRGVSPDPASHVDFIVAHGVSAYVRGDNVLVGSWHFISEDEGVDCSQAASLTQSLRRQGKTLLYVSRNGSLEGVIALEDTVRLEAGQALQQLKDLGIGNIVMLTGDHPDTAQAIAARLPALDEVHWEQKPEDKAEIVSRLKEQGSIVAFVGDGVNDTPALVNAQVGICMPGGADLAREAAQVILMQDDLRALVTARHIAQRTQHTVKQCFWSSVGLNTLFLLLAGSGRLPPVSAAILHNANTLGTLGYAALSGIKSIDHIHAENTGQGDTT
ncbi:MAG: heavy metal translocating P-type ATPase [Desulfovermiculus sp.]